MFVMAWAREGFDFIFVQSDHGTDGRVHSWERIGKFSRIRHMVTVHFI